MCDAAVESVVVSTVRFERAEPDLPSGGKFAHVLDACPTPEVPDLGGLVSEGQIPIA